MDAREQRFSRASRVSSRRSSSRVRKRRSSTTEAAYGELLEALLPSAAPHVQSELRPDGRTSGNVRRGVASDEADRTYAQRGVARERRRRCLEATLGGATLGFGSPLTRNAVCVVGLMSSLVGFFVAMVGCSDMGGVVDAGGRASDGGLESDAGRGSETDGGDDGAIDPAIRIDGEELVYEAWPAPETGVVPAAEDDARADPPGATVIVGSIFYEDLRVHGNWSRRFDRDGAPGARWSGAGAPPPRANLLGALDATVDVWSIGGDCGELLASAAVAADGSYRVAYPPTECPAIAIAFRLSACTDEYCVSVIDGDATPVVTRQLFHPRATPSAPASIEPGTHDAGIAVYGRADDPAPQDLEVQAAAVFASLIDAVRYLHRDHDVPFGPRPTVARFPGIDAPRTAGNTIHVAPSGTSGGGWENQELFHEYGHVVYSGGFGCSEEACPGGIYARNGEGFWGRRNLEYPYAAYTEGHADFIERAIDGTCEELSFDDNAMTPPIWQTDSGMASTTLFENGDGVPRNVTRFFCDLLDDTVDDDPGLPGTGDHLQLSITDIQAVQTQARVAANAEVCRFVGELASTAPDPGGARDIARQNGIDCP